MDRAEVLIAASLTLRANPSNSAVRIQNRIVYTATRVNLLPGRIGLILTNISVFVKQGELGFVIAKIAVSALCANSHFRTCVVRWYDEP